MTRFTIQPIHTDFAAEVFDIDLSKKQSSADINLVKEAFNWTDNFMQKEAPQSSATRLV